MSTRSPNTYESLHFHNYLDGGDRTLYSINWAALQNDAPLYCQQPAPKHLKQVSGKKYSVAQEYELVLERHSHISQQLLGLKAVQVEFPGGWQRCSFRLILEDDRSVIVTRRTEPARARYESLLMRRLESLGAATPRHLAFNGLILIQEELPGIRLSEALRDASEPQYGAWIARALESLSEIRRLALSDGLDQLVPIVGADPDWLIAFIDRTALLGNYAKLPCPAVPANHLYERLMLLKPVFNKWDARPGNAMLEKDGSVSWFDWEHCCARNPLDDMAWLLCDDATPEYPETENQLIDRYLADFADDQDADSAFAYLSIFGTHHACIRICRLLSGKADDSWLEYERRVNAHPGELLATTRRLCRKASRWSQRDNSTAMLSDWFLEIAERMPEL